MDNLDKVSKLTLNTVADDGVVVYVNGTEVARQICPPGGDVLNVRVDRAQNSQSQYGAAVHQRATVRAGGRHEHYRGGDSSELPRDTRLSFDLTATMTKQP